MAVTTPLQFAARFIIGAVLLAVLFLLLAPLLLTEGPRRRVSCQNYLKQMGIIYKMYSGENRGEVLPPVGPYAGLWVPDLPAIYPEYLADFTVTVCPDQPDAERTLKELSETCQAFPSTEEKIARCVARSYTYCGWAIDSADDVAAIKQARANGNTAMRYEDVRTDAGLIHRLQYPVSRFLITDIADPASIARLESQMSTQFDTVTPANHAHTPPGANVLYMDGHVEFIKQGDRFPVTPATQKLLAPVLIE